MYTNKFRITAAHLFDEHAPHNRRSYEIARQAEPFLTMDEHLLRLEDKCQRDFGGISQFLEALNNLMTPDLIATLDAGKETT